MKKLLGKLKERGGPADDVPAPASGDDSPEANVTRAIKTFCESGGVTGGDEVAQLPTIVEAAESSPGAAKTAANILRKYMTKDYYSKPHIQYNSVMLLRILSTNPGPSFTRNMDARFVSTLKECARYCKDPSVLQILRETLDAFGGQTEDEGLNAVREMWSKEKASGAQNVAVSRNAGPQTYVPPQAGPLGASARNNSTSVTKLPSPEELAGRIEEAKTSAKLLLQVVQSTPANEIPNNDLIREFAERCSHASRSMQKFIHCQNPSPDEDTMLTLIETNDQLAMAMSRHQRALLQARKEMSRENSASAVPQVASSPPAAITSPAQSPPVASPAPQAQQSFRQPGPTASEEDPFADQPHNAPTQSSQGYPNVYGTSAANPPSSNAYQQQAGSTANEQSFGGVYDPPTPVAQRRAVPDLDPVSPVAPSRSAGLGSHPPAQTTGTGYPENAYQSYTAHNAADVSPPGSPDQRRTQVGNEQYRY